MYSALSSKMYAGMTRIAKCDQILFRVAPRVAAELLVVDFEIRHRAARLTPPTIAAEDLLAKVVVRNRIQSHAHGLRVI